MWRACAGIGEAQDAAGAHASASVPRSQKTNAPLAASESGAISGASSSCMLGVRGQVYSSEPEQRRPAYEKVRTCVASVGPPPLGSAIHATVSRGANSRSVTPYDVG